MMWMDYVIDSLPGGLGFKVRGDWEGEVMGVARDGTQKDHYLYKPGDVFIVDENGWLRKTEALTSMITKYEEGKNNGYSKSD